MARLSQRLNDWQARRAPPAWRDAPGLLILAAHAVTSGRPAALDEAIDPQLSLGLDEVRRALVDFLEAGYRFAGLSQLAEGLDPRGRHCLLTFDDGYRGQLAVLPLLEEFRIPAVFFVVPHHVETSESFWWDALYRHGRRIGKSLAEIRRLTAETKKLHPARIRGRLISLGLAERDFRPIGDEDRSLSADELRALAGSPHALIGNHTYAHEILTRCGAEEQRATIRSAQAYLEEKCGGAPSIIAYPNGDCSASTLRVVRDLRLPWGVTVEERRERLPLPAGSGRRLRLGRHILSRGDIAAQCRRFRLRYPLTPGRLAPR